MCDFAEYYHLFEWEALPVGTQAALAAGLPPESRSKMKLNGQKHPQSLLMLAMILDTVNIMAWRQTENGVEGKNPPKSIYNILTGKEDTQSQNEYQTFSSGEEFEAARNEILRRGGYIQ